MTSESKTLLHPREKRLWLFVGTFVIGLLLAALRVGLIFGWQPGFFSLMTVLQTAGILITTSLFYPLPLLLFPLGLKIYFPDDLLPKLLLFSAWTFYLVTSLLGILVKRRGFVLVMYSMFVILLILNIIGCGPAVMEALAGLD